MQVSYFDSDSESGVIPAGEARSFQIWQKLQHHHPDTLTVWGHDQDMQIRIDEKPPVLYAVGTPLNAGDIQVFVLTIINTSATNPLKYNLSAIAETEELEKVRAI